MMSSKVTTIRLAVCIFRMEVKKVAKKDESSEIDDTQGNKGLDALSLSFSPLLFIVSGLSSLLPL